MTLFRYWRRYRTIKRWIKEQRALGYTRFNIFTANDRLWIVNAANDQELVIKDDWLGLYDFKNELERDPEKRKLRAAGVFNRDECCYQYCPHKDLCQKKCLYYGNENDGRIARPESLS